MTDKDTKKPAEFFVSRRGRQVGVHQVDLDGIDIDNVDGLDTAVSSSKKYSPKPSKVVKSPRAPKSTGTKLSWSRKRTIISLAVAGVILIPFLLAELVATQYRDGASSARKDLATVIDETILPAQKKSAISADQIRTIANKVNDIVGHMCRGGLLDNAASLYPRAKSALNDCKTSQSKYAVLTNNLYDLEAQARYLEQMDAIIKPIAQPITDEFAVIGAQQTAWQTAAESIKKLSPPEIMKPVHIELSKHVTAVAAGWSQLNTANNSQDGPAFQEAEKVLSAEYEAVRTSSAGFTAILTGTQLLITTNYNALK